MHVPSMKPLQMVAAACALLLVLVALFAHFFSTPLTMPGGIVSGVAAIPPFGIPVLSDIAWAINLFINCAIAAFFFYLLLTAKKGR